MANERKGGFSKGGFHKGSSNGGGANKGGGKWYDQPRGKRNAPQAYTEQFDAGDRRGGERGRPTSYPSPRKNADDTPAYGRPYHKNPRTGMAFAEDKRRFDRPQRPAQQRDARPFQRDPQFRGPSRPLSEGRGNDPIRAHDPADQRVPEDHRPPTRALGFAPEADLPRENLLVGRNPIREALKSGRDFERLLVARGDLSGSARELISMARERHIVVQEVDRVRLDALAPGHQGMAAFVSAFRYATLEDMLAVAEQRKQPPLLVILDGVTDPHNLGAIIRTAECAGAHGVIIPERRAVGLTPAAVKASAGAVEYLPVARVGNIPRLIEQLKVKGIWVFAAVMSGAQYDKVDLAGPAAIVIGAEGEGVSRLVKERCDQLIALPLCGRIESLNASTAAGVLLYEAVRQRQVAAK